ncbi:MAG: cation diffusion facilitator family transporter [Myxococcota bacterium]
MTSEAQTVEDHAERLRAGRLSLGVGIAVFGGKLLAYILTGSNAIFADAMESTVNVVAAAMLVFSLILASKPPDRDHPYGHGRIEFLSAALEGTAVTVAALLILVASVRDLLAGPSVQSIDLGLGLTVAFSLVNLLLGRRLIEVGRRTRSMALVADGRHILTDVWTSGGVVAGLGVVWLTGWVWADPLVAIVLAVNVLREGWLLMRSATAGLMDQADPDTLDHLVTLLAQVRGDELIDAHSLRSWRSGARRHVDLHVTVPRYFDVERIHQIHDTIEEGLFGDDPNPGGVVVHFDPCDPSHCRHCSMPSCPIRGDAFEVLLPFERERLVREDAASHGPGATERASA